MTNGQKLKKELGLESYPHVYISYVIGSSPDTLVVLYDSVRKNMPISSQYMKRYSNITFLKRGKELRLSSPFDIERSNHNVNTGMILVYDIAMSAMTTRESTNDSIGEVEYIYNLHEGVLSRHLFKGYVGRLSEITLKDLKDKSALAPLTKSWKDDRGKIMGNETGVMKLIDTFINQADSSVTFAFQTQATEYKDIKGLKHDPSVYKNPKARVSPLNLGIMSNNEKKYEIQIKVLEFMDWIKAFEGDTLTIKELKDILRVSDVQIFSTSPFFQYGSLNYYCSQLDASAYPTNIAPKVWNKRLGGEYLLTKELANLVYGIEFFYNQMVSQLNKKLKDRGLI